MKRIKREDLLKRQRIRRRWRLHELQRARKKAVRTRQGKPRLALPTGAQWDSKHERISFEVPQELGLRESREATLRFLEETRRLVLVNGARVVLDFSKTEKISPSAMLLLLAEIYRCRKARPASLLSGTYPRNDRLHRHMQACGFFKLLNVKHRLPEGPKTYPLDYIQFMTGVESVGRDAAQLKDALVGPSQKWRKAAGDALYRGLTEAMTNVVNHAYPEGSLETRFTRLRNQWWMVGSFNERRKEFQILFFDQGVGIPQTLPKTFGIEAVRSVLAQLAVVTPNDGELIQAAMEIGRTKTRQEHRGKGLNDFKRLIDACHGGRLRILSNRGEYQYSFGGQERVTNFSDSVRGTLIEWSVPIRAIENLASGESDGDDSEVEHRT